MRIIGLTGGIGTGKSTVAQMFRDEGFAVVDADRIAREVVSPGTPAFEEIVRRFGRGILLPGGGIDRKSLGDIVFSDPEKRAALESITHPRIAQGIADALSRLEREGNAVAIVEAALIHEKGRRGLFDAVVSVRCADALQVRRLVDRDGITEEQARRRISSQSSQEEKAGGAEYVIDTSGDLSGTRAQVHALSETLRKKG